MQHGYLLGVADPSPLSWNAGGSHLLSTTSAPEKGSSVSFSFWQRRASFRLQLEESSFRYRLPPSPPSYARGEGKLSIPLFSSFFLSPTLRDRLPCRQILFSFLSGEIVLSSFLLSRPGKHPLRGGSGFSLSTPPPPKTPPPKPGEKAPRGRHPLFSQDDGPRPRRSPFFPPPPHPCRCRLPFSLPPSAYLLPRKGSSRKPGKDLLV